MGAEARGTESWHLRAGKERRRPSSASPGPVPFHPGLQWEGPGDPAGALQGEINQKCQSGSGAGPEKSVVNSRCQESRRGGGGRRK